MYGHTGQMDAAQQPQMAFVTSAKSFLSNSKAASLQTVSSQQTKGSKWFTQLCAPVVGRKR
jgi:hypothetical protein